MSLVESYDWRKLSTNTALGRIFLFFLFLKAQDVACTHTSLRHFFRTLCSLWAASLLLALLQVYHYCNGQHSSLDDYR